MGRKCNNKNNKKKLTLSAHRKSRKRFFFRLRKERQNKLQAEYAQIVQNVENATNIHLVVNSKSDIDLKVDNETLPCLTMSQVKKEKSDNENQIETYEEESICNENIAYCKDKDNSVLDNDTVLNNEEKIEVYEECKKEYEEEGNTYNENIENCEDEDLIIDNNSLSDRINNIPKNIPEGRIIVDFAFMWNELQRTFNDHTQGIECQFKYWQLVNFRRRGLLTQLFFKCQMCNYEANFWTEPKDSENNINAVATAACAKVGIGYTQMEKLFSTMN